jgi:N-acetyl-alpha-D-muramate 1-phosphate uridylyltransferase
MDPLGRLTRRRSGEIAPFVFAGVQILKPELFADVPSGAFSTNLIWDRLLESERLYGMRHDGLWFHVGTPASIGEVDDHLEVRPHHRES